MIDFLSTFPASVRYKTETAFMAGCATVFKSQFLRQYHHST